MKLYAYSMDQVRSAVLAVFLLTVSAIGVCVS